MGGIVSKRKFFIKTNQKKKRQKNERITEEFDGLYEEPLYMEIGLDRDVSSVGSRHTLPSSDSAFSERSSTLDRSARSSIVIYDEPGGSICNETVPKRFYQTDDVDDDVDVDDDDYSDVHTYISEVSVKKPVGKDVSTKRCGSVIPLEEVPYMVEAFQPLLERTIDVMEIIPHMPFIDAHEFVKIDDQRKAVELFVARIKASNEPGKWQAFLHALNLTEYEYIVSLLMGETEEDHSANRNLLRLFTPHIMKRVDPEEFIDQLFEKGVINERDMEEVRCEKDKRGPTAASFMLLHKVPRRISNWFEVFLDVLSKCGMEDVVQDFRIPEISVTTNTQVKQTFIQPKKKRLRGISRLRRKDPDEDYLTPVWDTERHNPYVPSPISRNRVDYPPSPAAPPPLPGRVSAASTHMQYAMLPRRRTTNEVTPTSENRTETEFELLQEKKDSLRRRVDEKKLIRRLNAEVKALQKELEELNSEGEEEDKDGSEDSTKEKTQSSDTANGNCLSEAESLTMEKDRENSEDRLNRNGNYNQSTELSENDDDNDVNTGDQDSAQDTEVNNSSLDDKYVNADPLRDAEGQTSYEEHISNLFEDMKQELKQDILDMRDHVTEAVLKSFISSTTRPVSLEDNTYVTVEAGQTILPSPIKLYHTTNRHYPGLLSPTSHHVPRLYSVDSAMFSDYIPMSDYTC